MELHLELLLICVAFVGVALMLWRTLRESITREGPTFRLILLLAATSVLLRTMRDVSVNTELLPSILLLPEDAWNSLRWLQRFVINFVPSAITVALVLTTGAVAACHLTASFRPTTTYRSKNAKECLSILDARSLPSLSIENGLSQMTARAMPNKRLVVAFGINNCFSTSDQKYCNKFHKFAEEKIVMDDSSWKELARTAGLLVKRRLSGAESHVELAPMIQFVAMKLALGILFNIPARETVKDRAIQSLAAEVNNQWILSKGTQVPYAEPVWKFENQRELLAALTKIFPGFNIHNSIGNPMNLILPAYETLWRAVLRCFLELTARNYPDSVAWQQVLQDFAANPSRKQIDRDTINRTNLSAAFIAQEALRLYPPTRRVNRMYQDEEGNLYDVAADVEACQRDIATWGPDAMKFEPGRFLKLREQGKLEKTLKDCFMPFGSKPFTCPAKRSKDGKLPFGMAMIAMLVGKLTAEVDGRWRVVGKLPEKGVPLDSGREAYHDLVLMRNEYGIGHMNESLAKLEMSLSKQVSRMY